MKSLLLSLVLVTIIGVSFVSAIPVDNGDKNEANSIRTRRDMAGLFDSIANGLNGFVMGAKKFGDSVFIAFNGFFSPGSTGAKNSPNGLEQFGNGLKDSSTDSYGSSNNGGVPTEYTNGGVTDSGTDAVTGHPE